MDGCYCFGYTKSFKILDLKFHKDQKLAYECAKLIIWHNELRKGYYPVKFNKPTRKGTSVKFRRIESKDEVAEHFDKFTSLLYEFKSRYELKKLKGSDFVERKHKND